MTQSPSSPSLWGVALALGWCGCVPCVPGADSAADDTSIPTLGPDAMEGWWPGLAPHLPHGFVSVSGGAMPGGADDGPMADGSVWAGGFRHPSARWSYGAAVGYSQRRWGLGDEFPDESHGLRVAVGAWRRFSLDDHLLLIAAPGVSWARPDAGYAVSAPLAGLWVHRSGRHLVWAVGALGVVGTGRTIALPIAGAVVFEGPWTFVITPIALSADRLLSADTSLGVFAGLGGDFVPVEDAGQDRWATYWDLRLGLRGRTKASDDLSLGAEAGCAVLRRAFIADAASGGNRLAEATPAPAPYAALTATWSF